MIRLLDIIFSLSSLILFLPLLILIYLVGLLDTGSPLFFQTRVGLNSNYFSVLKFRTMKLHTLHFGTHLVNPLNVTYFGYFLRKFKLDELPQLWNVLVGDMSFVGPRPCLPNQKKLIVERKKRGVLKVRPGITGLAQVNGIDMSTPTLLAKTDSKMIKQMSLFHYLYYILKTVSLILKKNHK